MGTTYYSVRKVFDLIFFCENLVDFNQARLHKATLNLHTHVCFFPCLPIVSVNGKQDLSEVVFNWIFIDDSDLVSGSYPYTQDSSSVIIMLMKSGLLFVESSMSCGTST